MQSSTTTSPGPPDETFMGALRSRKADLIGPVGSDGTAEITQTGSADIGDHPSLPDGHHVGPITEPLIDMFVCGADGSCQATGTDPAMAEFWTPSVRSLAELVYRSLADHGVAVDPLAYVTASLTPARQVVGEAHFDDDQYLPEAGVGVVAIVGSDIGPRVATEPVPTINPRSGLPLAVDQQIFDRFSAGQLPHQQTAAGRIVIFPQFGQLHAGPPLAETAEDPTAPRSLLVFRAATTPLA